MLIDPRHLEHLSVILDAGTLQEAAGQIGTSQPALSRMISGIETRIGMPLFERSSRPLKPTAIGLELANQGRTIRVARHRAFEFVDLGSRGFFGVLKIGAPPFMCERLVSEAIADFVTERPDVRIELIPDYYTGLQERIFLNQIDLIICPAKFVIESGADLTLEPLFEDSNVVVARANHPLTTKRVIDVGDLQAARWICHSERSALRADMEMSLKLLGVKELRLSFQSESAGAVMELLRDTDFLTVLPRYAFKPGPESGLDIVPVDLPKRDQTVSMITHSEREESKLIADFKAHMRTHVAARQNGSGSA